MKNSWVNQTPVDHLCLPKLYQYSQRVDLLKHCIMQLEYPKAIDAQ